MIGIALAGGCGALGRFLTDRLIIRNRKWLHGWSILLINVVGSFLLGLLTGQIVSSSGGEEWRLILGVGFLGGYTTFSTACVDSARLLRRRKYRKALLVTVTMLLGSVAAAGLGLWLTAG